MINITLVMVEINNFFNYYNFTLFFSRMVQRGEESYEVRYSKNLAGTHWPLKQLLLLHGGPFQTSDWQERTCCHVSRPSFIHRPSATLPWAPSSHSSGERAAFFTREQPVRERGRRRSRWQFQRWSCGEEPILPQPKRHQWLGQRSWSHQVQCRAVDVQAEAVELVGWKCASRRSEKASPNFFQLLYPSRRALLLPQCDQSFRGNRNTL